MPVSAAECRVVEDRWLHAGRLCQAVADRTTIVFASERDGRPPVVQAALDDVDLIATEWAVLGLPELTGRRIEREAVRVAMPVAPDLGTCTGTTDERIVVRYASVVAEPNDFAEVGPQLLCEHADLAFAECDEQVSVC